jgi:hypothetical protein
MKTLAILFLAILPHFILDAQESGWTEFEEHKVSNTTVSPIIKIKSSIDGKEIWTLSEDNWLRMWDSETGEITDSLVMPHANVDFDITTRRYIVGTEPGENGNEAKVFSIDDESLLYSVENEIPTDRNYDSLICRVAFSKSSKYFYVFQHYYYEEHWGPNSYYWTDGKGYRIRNEDGKNKVQIGYSDYYLFDTDFDDKTTIYSGIYTHQKKLKGVPNYENNYFNSITTDTELNKVFSNDYYNYLSVSHDGKYFGFHNNAYNSQYRRYMIFDSETQEEVTFYYYDHFDYGDIFKFELGGYKSEYLLFSHTKNSEGSFGKINAFEKENNHWIWSWYSSDFGAYDFAYIRPDFSYALGCDDGRIRIVSPAVLRPDTMVTSLHLDKPVITIGESINFTAYSSQDAKYSWDFGDGTTSKEKTPSHEYKKIGFYTVKLLIESNDNVVEIVKKDTVEVKGVIRADFSFNLDGYDLPINVQFRNKSTGPYDSVRWNLDVLSYRPNYLADEHLELEFDKPVDLTVELEIWNDVAYSSVKKNVRLRKPVDESQNILYDYIFYLPSGDPNINAIASSKAMMIHNYNFDQDNYYRFRQVILDPRTLLIMNSRYDYYTNFDIIEDEMVKMESDITGYDKYGYATETKVDISVLNTESYNFEIIHSQYNDYGYTRYNAMKVFENEIALSLYYEKSKWAIYFERHEFHKDHLERIGSEGVVYFTLDKTLSKSDNKFLGYSSGRLTLIKKDFSVIEKMTNYGIDRSLCFEDNVIVFAGDSLIVMDDELEEVSVHDFEQIYSQMMTYDDNHFIGIAEFDRPGFDLVDYEGNLVVEHRFEGFNGYFTHVSRTSDDMLLFSGLAKLQDGSHPWVLKYDPKDIFVSVDEDVARENNRFTIHPNPTSGMVYFDYDKLPGSRIEIYDLLGNKVASLEEGAGSYDCSGLSTGIYFVVLKSNSGIYSEKMIVR